MSVRGIRYPARHPAGPTSRTVDRSPTSARQLSLRGVARRSWNRREVAWERALPEVALRLARQCRIGRSIDAALVEVIESIDEAPPRIGRVRAQLDDGRPLPSVLGEWSDDARSEPERVLIAALQLGATSGAQLSRVLDGVSGALRDEIDLDARRRVFLVQAQLSAAVLVALPVIFALVTSVARGSWPYATRIGFAMLAAGLCFDVVGVVWMRRLLRRLQ